MDFGEKFNYRSYNEKRTLDKIPAIHHTNILFYSITAHIQDIFV
jgi:hypothetical protein